MLVSHKPLTPFLRWAGGKNWLIKYIEKYLPENFYNYYEPFLGGGALAIHLLNSSKIKKSIILSDSNPELINTYVVIRDNIEELLCELLECKNEKEFYYYIREMNYQDPIKCAARFIYLNRTSFNGIYRENLKGEYNVPYGFKKYGVLFDVENMINLSKSFSEVSFNVFDFELIVDMVGPKDLVFLDPPYTVAHQNNGFIKYNQKIFSWGDQERLLESMKRMSRKGAYILLTNAYHENIFNLYGDFGNKNKIERYSLIGGKNAHRKKYPELILTNF